MRLVSVSRFHTRHLGARHTGRHYMKILSGILGGILLSFLATSAGANIIFNAIPSGTGNNVQFNDQPPDQSGTTIFGNINDPNDTLVQFTSTQTLVTPALGQSRIESDPDNVLNNLVTTIPGFFFDQAVFNLDATANGTANISAFDQFGTQFDFVLPLDGSGTAELLHAYDRGWRTHLQRCVHNNSWLGGRIANSIWEPRSCSWPDCRRRTSRTYRGLLWPSGVGATPS